MKKCWIAGAILLASLALNVTFISMFAGRSMHHHGHGMPMLSDRLQNLPEASRAKVADIIERDQAQMKDAMKDIKQSRKETFQYIKSGDYNRQQAEQKLAVLRAKTAALQASAQQMMLDVADKLTPDERSQLFARKDRDKEKETDE